MEQIFCNIAKYHKILLHTTRLKLYILSFVLLFLFCGAKDFIYTFLEKRKRILEEDINEKNEIEKILWNTCLKIVAKGARIIYKCSRVLSPFLSWCEQGLLCTTQAHIYIHTQNNVPFQQGVTEKYHAHTRAGVSWTTSSS